MPKKIDQYGPERLEVLNKIFQIINITDANNMFSLHKVDNDKAVQDALIGLESDVKKYFICSEWSCFKKKDIVKRRWLSMIKSLSKKWVIILCLCNSRVMLMDLSTLTLCTV